MQLSQIGVIGLATMGANLAQNFSRNGLVVSVYNRSYSRTLELLEKHELYRTNNQDIHSIKGFQDLADFIHSLEKPRKIFLLIKSGEPVDSIIKELYPLLEAADILIDTGNSNWQDTQRRQKQLSSSGGILTLEEVIDEVEPVKIKQLHFVGCGVSGGEQGALLGPSLMPGGDPQVVAQILPFLEKIAAKDFEGKPCVTNIGVGPSGHFVKMVHNGIEYAIMQGIVEIYDILRKIGLGNQLISDFFGKLNTGKLEGFLLEISTKILSQKDNLEEGFLVDKIHPSAGAKGTGKWTVEAGMNLGIAIPNISSSLFARIMSARTHNFLVEPKEIEIKQLSPEEQENLIKEIDFNLFYKALEAIFYTSYLQGLDLILEAEKEYQWSMDLVEILRIWQGGCIIRSRILTELKEDFENQNQPKNLTEKLANHKQNLISMYEFLSKQDFELPLLSVFNSSLDYVATLTTKNLPTNLIQAQRDYFGNHTYKRIDKDGDFSGGWEE